MLTRSFPSTNQKTGCFLFPNPIRKTAIFVGKFMASALVSLGAIGLYYVIAVVSVRVIDGSIPANTGLSSAYSLAYLFAILAIAYLLSAIMRSSVHSLVARWLYFGMGTVKSGLYSIARAVGYRMKTLPPSATGARV